MAGLAGVKADQGYLGHRASELHVLIVNHRAFLRRVQSDMLSQSGIVHIETRTGGIAAVEAPAHDVGLVLCGYDMPQGDGLWLLKKIRLGETAYAADVPFIFVTDAAERWLISSAMNLDVDGYVLLPASRQKMDEVLQLALRRARPHRQRDEYVNTSIIPPDSPDYAHEWLDEERLAESGRAKASATSKAEAPAPEAATCFGLLRDGAELLPLRDLKPDMVLGADLISEKGAVLLPAGAVLTESSVRRLRSVADAFGFDHVPVTHGKPHGH